MPEPNTATLRCRRCGRVHSEPVSFSSQDDAWALFQAGDTATVEEFRRLERLFSGMGWVHDSHEWFCPDCAGADHTERLN